MTEREYNRWPARDPRGRGGQFAPTGASTGWLGAVEARLPALPSSSMRDHDTVRRVLEYADAVTGLAVRIDTVKKAGKKVPRVVANGSIVDRDGKRVGQVDWTVEPENGSVYLANLILHDAEPTRQGQGFGTRYRQHYRRMLRHHGIRKIELVANVDVGGYSWAVAGMDFANQDSRRRIVARARGWVRAHPQWRPQVEELARRRDSAPIEWARIGWQPGLTTWPGKQLMKGSEWDAVEWLFDDE